MPVAIPTPSGITRELTNLRRESLKIYERDATRRQFKLVSSIAPVHYEAVPGDQTWLDIDTDYQLSGGQFRVEKAPFLVTLLSGRVGFSYQSRAGGAVTVELARVNDKALTALSPVYNPVVVNHTLWLVDFLPGLDVGLVIRRAGIAIYKRLKTPTAPRIMEWEIAETAPGLRIAQRVEGYDNEESIQDPGRLKMDLRRDLEVLSSVTQLGGGRRRLREEWTGRVAAITDPATRIKAWSPDVLYPVWLDPDITENIPSNNDDGHKRRDQGFWDPRNYGNATHNCGRQGTTYWDAGYRFTTIALDQGVTIDAGTVLKLDVASHFASGGVDAAKLYGENADTAPAWSDSSHPGNMTKTTASTTFSSAIGANSIDVQAIVQEIVNRAGWANGNAIRFGLIQQGVANYRGADINDFNGAGQEAILEINWTAAAGAGAPPGHGMLLSGFRNAVLQRV